MIDIVLSETCEFTYSAEDLCIGIWHRPFNKDKFNLGGFITFNNIEQLEHFKEMIELLLEKKNEQRITT